MAILAGGLGGCTSRRQPAVVTPPPPVARSLVPVQFTDITRQAGIKFVHNNGAFGIKLMPETMGSGLAFIDYDGDGYQDLFFINCRDWTEAEVQEYKRGKWSADELTVFKRHHPPGAVPTRRIPPRRPPRHTPSALYRNNRNGTFTDVTRGSGLDIKMFGMGAAVGDYDNDGRPDLYVTGLGRNYLFHNEGGGQFTEVATRAGLRDSGWSTSAAWLDYDSDGRLDLFVCHYVYWTPGNDRYGTMNGRDKSYTAPYFYAGDVSRLYHNDGNGKFKDVSVKAGIRPRRLARVRSPREAIERLPQKSLGVVVSDYNNDKWPDIIVANDSQPNCLFRNNKNGTFSEVSVESGIAYAPDGLPRAGMGIDAADIDHSNRDSVVIGNFDNEMIGLYYNRGDGLFEDIAPASEVGLASKTFSIFGCVFLDVDNDGWPDILTASGHIDEQITGIRGTAYALRPLLFLNDGRGQYREVGLLAGVALQRPLVGRGLAYGDIDLDGDQDVALTTNGGPALLLRNDGGSKNNSIRLLLQGTKNNRSGIGAVVKVKLGASGLRRMVRSGSSYLSQNELPLTLGLGHLPSAEMISIHWPSGAITRFKDVAAGQIITVDEAKGIVRRQLFMRPE
ncbi:MAG: CRTAC1 family protein [Armatimonadota bacterium]|nr:CRTAC1 family protein [Armatimonadota bacterium]